jgi:hypothetical protein
MKTVVMDTQATLRATGLLVDVNGTVKGNCMPTVTDISNSKAKKIMKKSKFPLQYFYPSKNPNALPINDLLQKTEYDDFAVEELLEGLRDKSNTSYWDAVANWKRKTTKVDPSLYPKFAFVEIGKMTSDQDINRQLNVGHATKIFAQYDPELFLPIYCIKTPGKDEWTIVNGQHTVTGTAAIVFEGFMKGVNKKHWKKFKVLVIYIETHKREKAREAFALLNGEMSLPIATYDVWKQHYLSVVLDQSKNPKYLHTYEIIMRLRKGNIVPLPDGHDEEGQPGALTHLDGIMSMCPFDPSKEVQDYSKLDWFISIRSKYLYDTCVDNAELGFFGRIFDLTEEHNIDRDDSKFIECMDGIMSVVQTIFKGLPTCKKYSVQAYKSWRGDNFGIADTGNMGFNGPLYFAYQTYRKLGGTFDIPKLYDMFNHKGKDALCYLDETYIERINGYMKNNKLVRLKYNLNAGKAPKKGKKK